MKPVYLQVRLNKSLHKALKKQAKKNNRSLNAEIVTILTSSIVRIDMRDLPDDVIREVLLQGLKRTIKEKGNE